MNRSRKFPSLFGLCAVSAALAFAQAPASAPKLTITGEVEKPLTLSFDDLKHLPRTTLKVTEMHEEKKRFTKACCWQSSWSKPA